MVNVHDLIQAAAAVGNGLRGIGEVCRLVAVYWSAKPASPQRPPAVAPPGLPTSGEATDPQRAKAVGGPG